MGNSKPLSVKFVETVREAGVYRDKGNPGLLLRVESSGAKRWVLRTTLHGQGRDYGLGSARDVSLREARERFERPARVFPPRRWFPSTNKQA
jgi:hypothetical protein